MSIISTTTEISSFLLSHGYQNSQNLIQIKGDWGNGTSLIKVNTSSKNKVTLKG